jgi:hypothetical protein
LQDQTACRSTTATVHCRIHYTKRKEKKTPKLSSWIMFGILRMPSHRYTTGRLAALSLCLFRVQYSSLATDARVCIYINCHSTTILYYMTRVVEMSSHTHPLLDVRLFWNPGPRKSQS